MYTHKAPFSPFLQSPGEIKSRELELGSHSRMDCLAAGLFLNSCFSDTVALLHTAVETAISEVYKLLGTVGVPNSLTLFWRWLTVSSVLVGRSAWTSYSSPPYPPPPPPPPAHVPSPISLIVSVDENHQERTVRPAVTLDGVLYIHNQQSSLMKLSF